MRDARRREILARARNRGEIFGSIYEKRMWGGSADFYSGHGSHDPVLTGPYLEAVTEYLRSLGRKPDVCDFGCGDFAIGAQLRPLCERYTAADVVPALIERNRRAFADRNVEFKVIDIVSDDLPDADVVFIREVLQHLSNDEIAQVLPKLKKYPMVIISEDLPVGDFTPNHDKPAGFDVRRSYNSGVDITAPPFNFPVKSAQVIARSQRADQIMQTTLYEPA